MTEGSALMTTTVLEPAVVPQTVPTVPDVIEVVVTLRHIEKSRNGRDEPSPWLCPLEQALRDQGFVVPCVGTSRMWIGPDVIDLPENVQDWIRRFDAGWYVEPERFLIPRKLTI